MRIFAIIAIVLAFMVPARAETIRVGVTGGPHAEILDVVKKFAAERGIDIKVIEFTDYVIPNQALAQKELEANSFQHEPYLKNQISKTGLENREGRQYDRVAAGRLFGEIQIPGRVAGRRKGRDRQ